MIIERRRNAKRNIITGTLFKLFQTLVPFVLRTVLIYTLGLKYVGLDSLFTSLLHVLNLAELGVGSAMVFCMYEPIAKNDIIKLRALLNLYKNYYRVIGFIVFSLGISIIPFLPNLISERLPGDVNLYVLYIINLLATVLSYWLYSYKNSILLAHQRTDIYDKIQFFSFSIQYIIQFAALIVCKSFYFYVTAILVSQIITNLILAFVTNRFFSDYYPEGDLTSNEKKAVNSRIKDLFTAKLGGTITNSTNAVVISAFLGISSLALYSNYQYILIALFGFMNIIFKSCLAGIGNSLVVETEEKNYHDFERFTLLLQWIIGYCTIGLYCLMQPFMQLWVHEENMLKDSYMFLLCIYFYVYELALIWATYKDAGGIWHQDRFRPFCVSVVNLSISLLTIKSLGLYSVILSTIISYLFVGMPWMLCNIFNNLFHGKIRLYIIKVFRNCIFTIMAGCITKFFCEIISLDGIVGFFLKIIVMTVVSNTLLFTLFYWTRDFKSLLKS